MIFCNCKATLAEVERKNKNLEAKFKHLEEFAQTMLSRDGNVIQDIKDRISYLENKQTAPKAKKRSE